MAQKEVVYYNNMYKTYCPHSPLFYHEKLNRTYNIGYGKNGKPQYKATTDAVIILHGTSWIHELSDTIPIKYRTLRNGDWH